jgi:DNA-directed RNA polymerase specialized sigma24 family protein
VSPFLRNIEALRLAEHEAQLRATPPRALPASPRDSRAELARLPPELPEYVMRKGLHPPPDLSATILRASQRGFTLGELAQRFGCSERTIQRHLRRAGAPLSKYCPRKFRAQQAVAL